MGACLLAFWYIFFMRVFIFDYGMFRLVSFFNEVLVFGSSHPRCDGNEGVDFPSVILEGVNSHLVCFCLRAWSGNLS